MKRQFPLFQSHIDLAHAYWARLATPEDLVIDATCGNGQDTLFLSKLRPKHIMCIDIQQEAIETTKALLSGAENISYFKQCHSTFPPEAKEVKLIVYNLGYLPRGDKTLTTKVRTTISSLESALPLIKPGGAVSITCYPGHAEGAIEEKEIRLWSEQLPPEIWNVCFHRFPNRKQSPSLFLLQK